MNSVEITRYLYQKGYLTKDAALKILKTRKELLKEATESMANEMFGFSKVAQDRSSLPVSMGKSMANVLPLLGLAAMITAGTTAAKVGLGAISDARLKGQVGKSYSQMFQEYPELQEDREKATKFFNMMARFAPVLASNPVVAGTWVKGTMDQNLVAPQNIKQLIEAQSEWDKTRSMKSPLIGLARELPDSEEIFKKSLAYGA